MAAPETFGHLVLLALGDRHMGHPELIGCPRSRRGAFVGRHQRLAKERPLQAKWLTVGVF